MSTHHDCTIKCQADNLLAENEKLKAHVARMGEALEWARNEMGHDLDQTGCCYDHCKSCKEQQGRWNAVWNAGVDLVDVALSDHTLREK